MKPVYKILIAAVIIAAILSPFASSNPDGLERVATDLGFIERGEGTAIIESPIADYIFPGIENEAVATAVAGIAGTVITFAVMYVLARVIKRKSKISN
ncbi:MAG: PDGLE domain-containing protein [Bacillota bacterium]